MNTHGRWLLFIVAAMVLLAISACAIKRAESPPTPGPTLTPVFEMTQPVFDCFDNFCNMSDLRIENATDSTICGLYIVHAGGDSWGTNMLELPDRTMDIPPGVMVSVALERKAWSVRVTDCDGKEIQTLDRIVVHAEPPWAYWKVLGNDVLEDRLERLQ